MRAPLRPSLEEHGSEPRGLPFTSEPLDPLARTLAVPFARAVEPPPAPRQGPGVALPDTVLLEQLVKRLSFGGNGRRGAARIELCAGSLAGATLVVHAEGRELTLQIDGADPIQARAFSERIGRRLTEKGFVFHDGT